MSKDKKLRTGKNTAVYMEKHTSDKLDSLKATTGHSRSALIAIAIQRLNADNITGR